MTEVLMVFEVSERGQHSLVQIVQVVLNFRLTVFARVFELHTAQLIQNTSHVVFDDRPGYLVLRLRCRLNRATSRVIKADQVVQHKN